MKTYTEDDLRDALRLLEHLVPQDGGVEVGERIHPRGGRTRQRLTVLAAMAVVAATAIAVALFTAGRHSPPSSHTGHRIQGPSSHTKFPLSLYRPSPRQLDLLFDAQYTLANNCLRAGYSALRLPTHIVWGTDFASIWTTGLRPTTVADAQRYGYRLPPSGDGGMSASQDRLLSNPIVHHCVALADLTLMGPAAVANNTGGLLGNDQNFVDDLISQSVTRALASPSMAMKDQAWSSCMSAHGFAGFRAPANAIQHADVHGPLTRSERRQAVRDAKCKIATAFMPILDSIVSTNQKALVAEHPHQLIPIYHRLEATLARARNVVTP